LFDARNQVRHAHVGDWEAWPALRMGWVEEEKRRAVTVQVTVLLPIL
jgi:hypothetical protein